VLHDVVEARAARPVRLARPRQFLMCPPTYFDVTYSINPWMEPDKPTDASVAMLQWERLRSLYTALGHRVEEIAPRPDLPDMVFAANGATVVDGRALGARFRHPQRAAEAAEFGRWLHRAGYPVTEPTYTNEGEGDYLVAGRRVLAGTGFRTDPRSHQEAQRHLGRPVVSLTLVDPRFYHLDTALAVLGDDEVMYHPEAFSAESQETLRRLYPDAILASAADAEVFGLNAVCDGRHVILPQQATGLIDALWRRHFVPIGVDVSELAKAGGSVKCCTLELRGPRRDRTGGPERC